MRTRIGTGDLANELSTRGFPAEAINGDLSQDARERTLGRFRSGAVKVLVATDVAARGLDIEGISHVFNYDLPDDAEVYIHRIGRTGRAGNTGIAISLVSPAEKRRLRDVERFARQTIARAELPTVEQVYAQRLNGLVNKVNTWLQRGRCKQERAIVDAMVAEGIDPLELAAAALKVARGDEKQRPIPAVSEVFDSPQARPQAGKFRSDRPERRFRPSEGEISRRGPRPSFSSPEKASHEIGMVRLTMNMGKAHGIRPGDVVGAIAYHADIPGTVIGKIFVQERETLLDVPENLVPQVLAQAGKYSIRRQPFTVERA